MPGSAAHVAYSDERPRGFPLPGRRDLLERKPLFFFLRSQSTNVSFTVIHLGLWQREGSMNWNCLRKIWSGRHWEDTWGSSCWDSYAGTYLHIAADIFLEKGKPYPKEKQLPNPVGYLSPPSGILLAPPYIPHPLPPPPRCLLPPSTPASESLLRKQQHM